MIMDYDLHPYARTTHLCSIYGQEIALPFVRDIYARPYFIAAARPAFMS